MAKIQFGGTVMDARGKVGGGMYSKNRSGAYIKRKVTPTNPNTGPQTVVRTHFTDLTKAWGGTLTPANRTNWNNFAALWPRTDVFGNSVKISGQNMYISLNQRALQIGSAIIADPPADLTVASIPVDSTSLVVASTPGSMIFNQTALKPAASSAFYVFATPALPPGRSPKLSDYRYIGSPTPATTGFPAGVDVSTFWEDVFGTIVAGAKYGVRVGTIDNITFGVNIAVEMVAISS